MNELVNLLNNRVGRLHLNPAGMFIPAEIMLDESLEAVDRMVYIEIGTAALQGLMPEGAEFIKQIGIKEAEYNASIKRLQERGYIG